MSKQCLVCGKEIIVGTKCMDCIKKEHKDAECGKQTEALTYKRLVAGMCIAATILIALVGCVWIAYSYSNADENNGYGGIEYCEVYGCPKEVFLESNYCHEHKCQNLMCNSRAIRSYDYCEECLEAAYD